jgi:hypothetical protein
MTVTFQDQINVSVQVGDLAWYLNPTPSGVPGNQYETASAANALYFGNITAVTPFTITVDNTISGNVPLSTDYFLFSKNNEANKSNLVGYYAEVTMVNQILDKTVELHSVGTEITESSK